jgi:hypothetical protein
MIPIHLHGVESLCHVALFETPLSDIHGESQGAFAYNKLIFLDCERYQRRERPTFKALMQSLTPVLTNVHGVPEATAASHTDNGGMYLFGHYDHHYILVFYSFLTEAFDVISQMNRLVTAIGNG